MSIRAIDARRLVRAITDPRGAWERLRRWPMLARYSGIPRADVVRFRREFRACRWFREHLDRHASEVPYVSCGEELYVIVRAKRPRVLVETGVASGISSACILLALDANGSGTLHSIDLPNAQEGSELPAGRPCGWLVPDSLRGRWHLGFGSTRQLLQPLLGSLRQVDLFFHDSDHSYEGMALELDVASRYVADDGLLLSDDTHLHSAWDEVCARRSLFAGRVGRLGIARRWGMA